MANIDRIQLIEKQHRNQLSDREQEQLEELNHDPDFAAEQEDFSMLLQGFDALHADTFADQLKEWDKKHQQATGSAAPKMVAMSRVYVYAAAAAVALILTLGFLFNNQDQDLLASHFSAENYASLAIDENAVRATVDKPTSPDQQQKIAGFKAFEKEQYAKVIASLTQYLAQVDVDDQQARLILSIAQLETGKAAQAIQNLSLILERPTPNYKAASEWVMALALIDLENHEAATKMLKRIVAQKGHEYEKEAQALLKDMKK